MSVLASKLSELGGPGKLAVREWQIRNRLGWHTKPRSVIRHLIYGERRATVEEANEIDAAHARWCAEKFEANRRENAALIASITEFAARAERVDAEFFGPTIEALRESLRRLGGQEDGPSAESDRAGRAPRGRRPA